MTKSIIGKRSKLAKIFGILTIALVCFASVILTGCGIDIRNAFNAGLKINRIIFTTDSTKFYSADAETYKWSDYTSNSYKNVTLYKNSLGGADVVYNLSYYDPTDSDDTPHVPSVSNFNQYIVSMYNGLSFDGRYAMTLNNQYSFSGIAKMYPLGGVTTYPYACTNSDCSNYNVSIDEDSSSGSYNCEICGQMMNCTNGDGNFHPDGTYSHMEMNWATGRDPDYGTENLKPLEFDELIIDGYDFYSSNFALKNLPKELFDYTNGTEKPADLFDTDDYSYMFSALPCKKITIMNAKGLQATGAKYNSRDAYLDYAINDIVVAQDEYQELDDGTRYTLDSFVEAYNNLVTEESEKLTKSKFLLNCLASGYIDCPITYEEYIEATYGMTLDEYVDAVNSNPSKYKYSAKTDGTVYTKQEVLDQEKSKIYGLSICVLTGLPVCTEQEMEEFYSSKTRLVNMSHMFDSCTRLEEVDFGNLFDGVTPSDLSYMFANCPNIKDIDLSGINTAYVTNMSNMFNITASGSESKNYASRDEQLLEAINTTIIPNYMPEIKKEDNSPYTSVDEALDAYNTAHPDDEQMSKFMLIIACPSIGIDIPVTYNDLSMALINMPYDELVTAAINDPASVDLDPKEDGTAYTEEEIQQLLLQVATEELGVTKLYTDEELAAIYAPKEERDDGVEKMLGELILGGNESRFVIAEGTDTTNMFSGNTAFANIVLPNYVAKGIVIDLPFTYYNANGNAFKSFDNSSAGQSLTITKAPRDNSKDWIIYVAISASILVVLAVLTTVLLVRRKAKKVKKVILQ